MNHFFKIAVLGAGILLFSSTSFAEVEVVEAEPVASLEQGAVQPSDVATSPAVLPEDVVPSGAVVPEDAVAPSDFAVQQSLPSASNPVWFNTSLTDTQPMMRLLDSIKLDGNNQDQQIIAEAEDHLFQNQPVEALQKLKHVKVLSAQPREAEEAYFIILLEAYARTNDLAHAVMARLSLQAFLEDASLQSTSQNILWRELQELPVETLNSLQGQAKSPLERGWLQLAIAVHVHDDDANQLAGAIRTFRQNNPDHPANRVLPDDTAIDAITHIAPPKKIALLLPLTGDFGKMGQAVRDGFMTAFYLQTKKLSSVPKIKIYDTAASGNIGLFYQQAIQDGADFVVGPLTKPEVETLSKSGEIRVPTLALNYLLAGQAAPANFIQFGLSPEQAAEQAADKAWQLGCSRLLVIATDSVWSRNIVQVFNDRLQALGGQVVDAYTLSVPVQASGVASILHTASSEERLNRLKQLFKKDVKSLPRRRQDIDGIFLVASPVDARQIYPLLNFYFAGNIPTVSISSIYSGYEAPDKDHDLDGIYFDDMPWVLTHTGTLAPLQQQIEKLWQNNYRDNSRLYALGADAFKLSVSLPRLMAMPNLALRGATGSLYLDNHQSIYRALLWARFKEGTPQLLVS